MYLARKADTGEICALKKMRKGTLAKMDEVKHVLVERDILTAVKTPWLVRLLYAFQDTEHVYLAMVSDLGVPILSLKHARLTFILRNTFLEVTSVLSSTTRACSKRNTLGSTLLRCSLVSTSSTNWDISIAISSLK